MALTKKHWTIIGIVVAIILVWYFFLRKKSSESSYNPNILIPGSGENSYVAGKCWTCGAAEARAGRCKPCGGLSNTGLSSANV